MTRRRGRCAAAPECARVRERAVCQAWAEKSRAGDPSFSLGRAATALDVGVLRAAEDAYDREENAPAAATERRDGGKGRAKGAADGQSQWHGHGQSQWNTRSSWKEGGWGWGRSSWGGSGPSSGGGAKRTADRRLPLTPPRAKVAKK